MAGRDPDSCSLWSERLCVAWGVAVRGLSRGRTTCGVGGQGEGRAVVFAQLAITKTLIVNYYCNLVSGDSIRCYKL